MDLELTDTFKGKCLVAMPSQRDDVFNQSVVYITEHSSVSGAVGVIINKDLPDKKPQLTNFDFNNYPHDWQQIPLYFGGPAELGSGFVLHQTPESPNWQLTGSRQRIEHLAWKTQVRPLMLTAGYCIWESLQLEREVRFNNWLIVTEGAEELLDVAPQLRYAQALRMLGVTNLAVFDFGACGNA